MNAAYAAEVSSRNAIWRHLAGVCGGGGRFLAVGEESPQRGIVGNGFLSQWSSVNNRQQRCTSNADYLLPRSLFGKAHRI